MKVVFGNKMVGATLRGGGRSRVRIGSPGSAFATFGRSGPRLNVRMGSSLVNLPTGDVGATALGAAVGVASVRSAPRAPGVQAAGSAAPVVPVASSGVTADSVASVAGAVTRAAAVDRLTERIVFGLIGTGLLVIFGALLSVQTAVFLAVLGAGWTTVLAVKSLLASSYIFLATRDEFFREAFAEAVADGCDEAFAGEYGELVAGEFSRTGVLCGAGAVKAFAARPGWYEVDGGMRFWTGSQWRVDGDVNG